jgi:hypothetical protein
LLACGELIEGDLKAWYAIVDHEFGAWACAKIQCSTKGVYVSHTSLISHLLSETLRNSPPGRHERAEPPAVVCMPCIHTPYRHRHLRRRRIAKCGSPLYRKSHQPANSPPEPSKSCLNITKLPTTIHKQHFASRSRCQSCRKHHTPSHPSHRNRKSHQTQNVFQRRIYHLSFASATSSTSSLASALVPSSTGAPTPSTAFRAPLSP